MKKIANALKHSVQGSLHIQLGWHGPRPKALPVGRSLLPNILNSQTGFKKFTHSTWVARASPKGLPLGYYYQLRGSILRTHSPLSYQEALDHFQSAACSTRPLLTGLWWIYSIMRFSVSGFSMFLSYPPPSTCLPETKLPPIVFLSYD